MAPIRILVLSTALAALAAGCSKPADPVRPSPEARSAPAPVLSDAPPAPDGAPPVTEAMLRPPRDRAEANAYTAAYQGAINYLVAHPRALAARQAQCPPEDMTGNGITDPRKAIYCRQAFSAEQKIELDGGAEGGGVKDTTHL